MSDYELKLLIKRAAMLVQNESVRIDNYGQRMFLPWADTLNSPVTAVVLQELIKREQPV